MDAFTASAPPEPNTPPTPHRSFRTIFLILLLAALLSAIATTYILLSDNKLGPQEQSVTQDENPFETQTTTNPFDEDLSSDQVVNPFAEEESANPFDQFETETTTTSGEYENPF